MLSAHILFTLHRWPPVILFFLYPRRLSPSIITLGTRYTATLVYSLAYYVRATKPVNIFHRLRSGGSMFSVPQVGVFVGVYVQQYTRSRTTCI